mmetsp:Transcript_37402/g.64923  ORF Transcript_37402/g.64923 Transcript_37402/m.64923 type:complete len:94 (-) Transcript_37402:164-445(-)
MTTKKHEMSMKKASFCGYHNTAQMMTLYRWTVMCVGKSKDCNACCREYFYLLLNNNKKEIIFFFCCKKSLLTTSKEGNWMITARARIYQRTKK